ncbi:MAG TPA: Pr6Pr family membrane protein [Jatrophihabitans sp.]|jgi:hypothetical protein
MGTGAVASRAWHATITVLVLVALALQVVVAVRVSGAPPQTTAGLLRGASLPGRIIRVLSFFTIQSNVLIGVAAASLALNPAQDGRVWRPLRLTSLVGITVTGIVYSTVLAKVHQPNGTAETVVNTLVHYVVPIMAVLGWLLYGPRPRVGRADVVKSLVFPAAWMAYTLVRGAIWHWYPYPFVDVVTHGYLTVAVNAVLVLIVLSAVAALIAYGDRHLPPRSARASSTPAVA